MSGTHVRVRCSAAGMVAGDFLAHHPGGRLAFVEVGRRVTPAGMVVDLVVLAAGMPDAALGEFARAWQRRHGLPAAALGAPFAFRVHAPAAHTTALPVSLQPADLAPGVALGHMVHGGQFELWVACHDGQAAEDLARRLRRRLPAREVSVVTGDPPASYHDCWDSLRLASEVAPPVA